MNRKEQLDLIRQKCIKANPEIVEQHSLDCDMDDSLGWVLKHHRCVLYHEPRLADVLLAIHERTGRHDIYASANGALIDFTKRGAIAPCWDLRQDDLTEQTPECVVFIYELLHA